MSPKGLGVHVSVAVWKCPSYCPPAEPPADIHLTLARRSRPAPHTAPTTGKASDLYQISTMAKQETEAIIYDDARMSDYRAFIAEAPGVKLFLVIAGSLHTSIADCLLDGITRQTAMSITRHLDIDVVERHIKTGEFDRGAEASPTGTAAEATPAASIWERHFLPAGRTCSIVEPYAALTRPSRSDAPTMTETASARFAPRLDAA